MSGTRTLEKLTPHLVSLGTYARPTRSWCRLGVRHALLMESQGIGHGGVVDKNLRTIGACIPTGLHTHWLDHHQFLTA